MKPFIVSMALLIINTANAGHETGNGGGAFVCRDNNAQITSAEVVDLWELENLNEQKAVSISSNDSIDSILHNGLLKLRDSTDSEFYNAVKLKLQIIKERTRFLESTSDIKIAPPSDVLNGFQKRGCPLEGVASYNDYRDQLTIDGEIWSSFSRLHQAALLMHESVYWVLRKELGIKNSLLARELTGIAFSQNFSGRVFSPSESETYICRSPNQQFAFFAWEEYEVTHLRFLIVDNIHLLRPAHVKLGHNLKEFLDGKQVLFDVLVDGLQKRPIRITKEKPFLYVSMLDAANSKGAVVKCISRKNFQYFDKNK